MFFFQLSFGQQVKEVPGLVDVGSLARSVAAAAASASCKTDPIINKVCPDTNYSFLRFLEGFFVAKKE